MSSYTRPPREYIIKRLRELKNIDWCKICAEIRAIIYNNEYITESTREKLNARQKNQEAPIKHITRRKRWITVELTNRQVNMSWQDMLKCLIFHPRIEQHISYNHRGAFYAMLCEYIGRVYPTSQISLGWRVLYESIDLR